MKHRLTIARFTFRQMLRGAVIFSVLIGLLTIVQGIGLQEAFPSQAERTKLVTVLGANPTIGLFYGEAQHADTPAGYMYYRDGVVSTLVAGIWGLLFATRMFRGQEDDGRSEMLLSGPTTISRMGTEIILGTLGGIAVAFLILTAIITASGTLDYIGLSISQSAYFAFALTINAVVFAALGALTSQLADTRRKAIILGVIPLVILALMRSIGNTVSDLYWLKNFTPFGWIDQMHPVYDHKPLWILPLVITPIILASLAVWISSRRDLGSSVLQAKDKAKSHFLLLGSSIGLSFRQTRGVMLAWFIGTLSMAIMLATLTQSAVDAFRGEATATQIIQSLGGDGPTLEETFISVGSMLVVLMLMAMVIWGVGNMRGEEAKGLLDNLLVRRVSRNRWLIGRVLLLVVAATVFCIIANLTTWAIAQYQDIDISLHTMLLDGLNLLAPVIVMLGLGVALFGVIPRLATWILYALLAWSFIEQVIVAIVSDETTKNILNSTSLLQPIALVPAQAVDWTQFWQVTACGLALLFVGFFAFSRRDLVSE